MSPHDVDNDEGLKSAALAPESVIYSKRKMEDGIKGMGLSQVSCFRWPASLMAMQGLAVLALILAAGGCGTSSQTPLPSLGPIGSSSLTQDQQKLAVQELNKKKETHEQEAIRFIESR